MRSVNLITVPRFLSVLYQMTLVKNFSHLKLIYLFVTGLSRKSVQLIFLKESIRIFSTSKTVCTIFARSLWTELKLTLSLKRKTGA